MNLWTAIRQWNRRHRRQDREQNEPSEAFVIAKSLLRQAQIAWVKAAAETEVSQDENRKSQ